MTVQERFDWIFDFGLTERCPYTTIENSNSIQLKTQIDEYNKSRYITGFSILIRDSAEEEAKELVETYKNIEHTLGGKPSLLWSRNGVHICQPVKAIVLEQEDKFAQFDHPSQTFLRFAARFLSNHKSDTNNTGVL